MALAKTTKDAVPDHGAKKAARKAKRDRVMGLSDKKFADLTGPQKTELLKACAIKLGLIQGDD